MCEFTKNSNSMLLFRRKVLFESVMTDSFFPLLPQWIRILHVGEEQCLWRHGCAGGAAVLALNHLSEPVDAHFAAAYFHKCSNYGADHIPQKSVGCDDKHHSASPRIGNPFSTAYAAYIGARIAVQFGKRCEILSVEKQTCRAVHCFIIKRCGSFPGQRIDKRVFGSDGIIVVGTCGSIETRMCVCVYRHDSFDCYILTYNGVEGANKRSRLLMRFRKIEMRYHH